MAKVKTEEQVKRLVDEIAEMIEEVLGERYLRIESVRYEDAELDGVHVRGIHNAIEIIHTYVDDDYNVIHYTMYLSCLAGGNDIAFWEANDEGQCFNNIGWITAGWYKKKSQFITAVVVRTSQLIARKEG